MTGIHRIAARAMLAAMLAGTSTIALAQDMPDSGSGVADSADAQPTRAERGRDRDQRNQRRVDILPYVEVNQILTAELKGGNEVLTYTSVAAGMEASVADRRGELGASLRYEHRFGWGKAEDADVINGLLRGRLNVTRSLSLEGGALATRTRSDGLGGARALGLNGSNVSNVYSLYAGPTFAQRIADIDVGAGYRFGYTKMDIDSPGNLGARSLFDSSTNHALWASIGQRPGGLLPVGWQLSSGWDREDASQLDQRYDGKYTRADVTVPVTGDLALLGGLGYERIRISQRDAVRDVNGVPIRDNDGRFVTDKSAPRQLAFETDGLIWDAGVMWQPSRRTSLTARVGRRYGDMNYSGALTYRPNHALQLQVGVYDTLSSFGRQTTGAIAALPSTFSTPWRDPFGGDIGGCVFGDEGSGNAGSCLNGALGNTTIAQFRSRGVQAVIGARQDRWTVNVGAGYDRRRLIAPGLAGLGFSDGQIDQGYYGFMSAARQLDAESDISFSAYSNFYDNGGVTTPDVLSYGATAAYARRFTRGLQGSAAFGVNAFDQDGFNTQIIGSALLGLRYSFR